jgi:hypothetical protein
MGTGRFNIVFFTGKVGWGSHPRHFNRCFRKHGSLGSSLQNPQLRFDAISWSAFVLEWFQYELHIACQGTQTCWRVVRCNITSAINIIRQVGARPRWITRVPFLSQSVSISRFEAVFRKTLSSLGFKAFKASALYFRVR